MNDRKPSKNLNSGHTEHFLPCGYLPTSMTDQERGGRRVKTADNLFDIIGIIEQNDDAGVSQISEEIGLAKSTVHEYLSTLTDRGYLINHDGSYQLGLKFYEHGFSARRRYEILEVVAPSLEQLAEDTGEAAWFIVEEHGQAFYLENALGEHSVQTHARVGKREHLHCLATGKAIMAYMPDERVSEIIERHGLPRKTSNTVTDPDELFNDLEEIREQGYAINEEEAAHQVSAIAAPVLTDRDNVVGGICISGPARRMLRKGFKTDFPDLILSATDEIGLRFDWES